MTMPFNQPYDNEDENVSVGHAIGDSLAGSTDPNMPAVPAVHADAITLTADEELLLTAFREHARQALTPERVAELVVAARESSGLAAGPAGRRALAQADVARLIHSLDRKLGMMRSGERIRDVSGIGYILWR